MITSILPIAQGVATSAEFTISAGVTDRIFLTDADGGGVPFRSSATVQRKGNGGQFQNVAWLDFWSPSAQVQGPGTFRVVRRGDTAVGVDRDTGADAVAAINLRLGFSPIASTDISSTVGAFGETRQISDGPDKGAKLVWAIPKGESTPAWCWWMWPQSKYEV